MADMNTNSQTNTSPASPAVPAGSYHLDPAHSTAAFSTRHLFGLATVHGTIDILHGEIVIADDGALEVSAVLAADSFTTGNTRRDSDVRGSKFLNSGHHPHLSFEAQRTAEAAQATGKALSGTLSVAGTRRPATLHLQDVTELPDGNRFRARASARIDRYAFGLTRAKGIAARHLDATLDVILHLIQPVAGEPS